MELTGHACLLHSLQDWRSRWLFRDSSRRVVEVAVAGDIVISSVLGLRDASLKGLGPALLADCLIRRELDEGHLVDPFPDHEVTATNFESGA